MSDASDPKPRKKRKEKYTGKTKPKINNPKLVEHVRAGKFNKVKRCLEKNCDVNVVNNYGETPLHIIVSYDHADVFDLLIKYGADINAKDNNGETPLNKAAIWPNNKYVEELIKYGAKVDKPCGAGCTPLMTAVLYNIRKNVRILLSYGANVNAKSNFGYTPLHCAASPITRRGKGIKTIELLLSHGANINTPNSDGVTALHIAVSLGNIEAVKILLDNKADANIKDMKGETPLHILGKSEYVTEMLLAYGADFTIKNNKGETPLMASVKPMPFSSDEIRSIQRKKLFQKYEKILIEKKILLTMAHEFDELNSAYKFFIGYDVFSTILRGIYD